MTQFKFIKTEIKGPSYCITIHRPEVFNAMNIETKFEIIKAIKNANANSVIRTIILTGEGKAFC